jgi:hypothetical protein
VSVEDLRCLFGRTLKVETDYGMARITIGRTSAILTPEGITMLVEILQSIENEEEPEEWD